MRVLVTGSTGQLGRELLRLAPAGVTVLAPARDALDLAGARLEENVVALAPQLILNAAAYTAV
ncbi:MAG: sugar nucleotide-binding protein, partial [Gammaproteobacteria bacterium]